MYYSSHSKVIEAWAGGDNNAKSGGNVFSDGDYLYSYGYHFVLATRVKDLKGKTVYLVNGDRYSVSTAKHTRYCIDILPDNFQIPFSALGGAGISTSAYGMTLVQHFPDHYVTQKYKDKHGVERTREVHHLGESVIVYNGRYFLSGLDVNESWGNGYYLTELNPKYYQPGNDPFKSLMPELVRRTVERPSNLPDKRNVLRQGEWYFVETNMLTRELEIPHNLETIAHRGTKWLYKGEPTTHTATEVRRLGDNYYARGTVRHVPTGWRSRTHKQLSLGKSWHLIVKNTSLGSWESAGNVD